MEKGEYKHSEEIRIKISLAKRGKSYKKLKLKGIHKECPNCHNYFYVYPSKYSQQFCSLDCKSKIICGSKHPQWKGGISPYSKEFKKQIRFRILERDNFTCQACARTKDLLVHHRDFNSRNDKLNNLITVCKPCHSNIHNSKKSMVMEVLKNR